MISILIVSPLAWLAMQKWLQGFAYRDGIHWWYFAVTALGAIMIAFVTISFQPFKATSQTRWIACWENKKIKRFLLQAV